MNLSAGNISAKDEWKYQIKLNTEKNKHPFLNAKESSKTMKEKRKYELYHQKNPQKPIKNNLNYENQNVSGFSEDLKMFKNYFDSKFSKTHKKTNNTLHTNNKKKDYQNINTAPALKQSTNNSPINNNRTANPFTHRLNQNIAYFNYKNKSSLTLKKNSIDEPNSQYSHFIKVTKVENNINNNNNTHTNIVVSGKQSLNNSFSSGISLNLKNDKREVHNLRESLQRIKIISKVQQYLDNRYSYKKEKLKEESHRRIIQSIKATKIANHKRTESLSVKRKGKIRLPSLTECLEKEGKTKRYSPLKYNRKKEQNGIKVVVYKNGKVQQIVEMFYKNNVKNWNEEIEKKISNFNSLLQNLEILKHNYSIILSKKQNNNEFKLKNIEEIIHSPNKIITFKDLQKMKKYNISKQEVNEELLGNHKFGLKLNSFLINSFELIQKPQKIVDTQTKKDAKINQNLKINNFYLNIICDTKQNNNKNILKQPLLTIIPQESKYCIVYEQSSLEEKKNLSNNILVEKQISLNFERRIPSFNKKIIMNNKTISFSYYTYKKNQNLHINKGENIQFIGNNKINFSSENSVTENHQKKLSIKERIALVNDHFLMGGKEQDNENIIQREGNEQEQNRLTMNINKPVAHIKKQKPTYKNFDENYSKSEEFKMQTNESLQKTVDKLKNFRNTLKKKK